MYLYHLMGNKHKPKKTLTFREEKMKSVFKSTGQSQSLSCFCPFVENDIDVSSYKRALLPSTLDECFAAGNH